MTPLLKISNLETIVHKGLKPVRVVNGLTLQIMKGKPLPY